MSLEQQVPYRENLLRVDYQHGIVLLTLLGVPGPDMLKQLPQYGQQWIAQGWIFVVVDIGSLDFIDTLTTQCLVDLSRTIANHGGRLALVKPQRTVVMFLRNNGVLADLPLYETHVQAFREFCQLAAKEDFGSNGTSSHLPHPELGPEESLTYRLLANNGFVLATLAQTLHSRGVLTEEDLETLFGPPAQNGGGTNA